MAATHPIRLDLPADLYARVQEEAAHSDQPVEAVLVESLALLFGAPSGDWDRLAATLEMLGQVQLWALVYRRLAPAASGQLRDLTARGQQEPLSAQEQAELAALIDEADRLTLLRSHALRALQQRGHAIQDDVQRGA